MIGNAYNVLLMLLTAAIVETHKQILLKHTKCQRIMMAGLGPSAEKRAPKLKILANLIPSPLDVGVSPDFCHDLSF